MKSASPTPLSCNGLPFLTGDRCAPLIERDSSASFEDLTSAVGSSQSVALAVRSTDKAERRLEWHSIYVLLVCAVTFCIHEVDYFLVAVTAAGMQKSQHWGPGDGTGTLYDVLVGPMYTAVHITAALPLGYFCDYLKRSDQKLANNDSNQTVSGDAGVSQQQKIDASNTSNLSPSLKCEKDAKAKGKSWNSRALLLAMCLFLWSLATIGTALSSQYWHVLLFRAVLALCTAVTQPACVSLISDYYNPKHSDFQKRMQWRIGNVTAMAVFNFSVYVGFSLAFAVGNAFCDANWSHSYLILGAVGYIWTVLVALIPNNEAVFNRTANGSLDVSTPAVATPTAADVFRYVCASPSLVLLMAASLWRNCGGYVWAFQAQNYYSLVKDESKQQIASYMSWIPAVAGSIGSLLNALVADRLSLKTGGSLQTKALLLLVCSCLCAFPFALGALLLRAPFCYLSLMAMYLFSEAWIGICVSLVVALSPATMKTSILSVYFLVIGCAGFSPLLVTPLSHWLHSYPTAVLLLFPCVYGSSALFFLSVLLSFRRDIQRKTTL